MSISLIFPAQGNPIAIKRTLDSTRDVVDEIIIGSVCIFEDDRKAIESYKTEYNIKVVDLPFNYIFKRGFSATLNLLASHVTNDICMYLNVGEIIDKGGDEILSKISSEYNCYYIDHSSEKHRWWRVFNPKEMQWAGLIHEECIGEHRPYFKPLFRFADTDKDTVNPFKAKVMNDVKETVYWQLLCSIVDDNSLLAGTNEGWLQFAESQYESMKERLAQKGKRYEAFVIGDMNMYINDVMTNPEFEKERFLSNSFIDFQGNKIHLL